MGIIENSQYKKEVWQMPVISIPVGINMKDSIILRPISSTDAMSADFTKLDWATIFKMKNEIKSSLKETISFVFFDITNKPPGTIE